MTETLTLQDTIKLHSPEEMRVKSGQNLESILSEARSEFARVDFIDSSVFDTEVTERARGVESGLRITVNMTAASLDRMLSSGIHESAWSHLRETGLDKMHRSATSQGKNLYDGYFEDRSRIESQLVAYITNPQAVEPIYAAMASTEQEHLHGASPAYGEVSVVLDDKKIDPNSMVYVWGDSIMSSIKGCDDGKTVLVEPKVLTREDAIIAKAVVDIGQEYHNKRFKTVGGMIMFDDDSQQEQLITQRAGYIETVIFQEVRPDIVQAVFVAGKIDTISDVIKVIETHPQIADKVIFVANESQPRIISDYLSVHYTTVDESQDKTETVKEHVIKPDVWEELGVEPSSSPAVIRKAIHDVTLAFLSTPELHSTHGYMGQRDLRTAKGMARYLSSLRGRVEANKDERLIERYKQILGLQEAARFFESIA